MTNIDEILQNPAFKNLDEERIEMVRKVYGEIQGKSQIEAISILMKYSRGFSEGKPISKEDRELMISVMLERLPPKEREMFQRLLPKQ